MQLTKEVKTALLAHAEDITDTLANITLAVHRDRSQTEETLQEEIDDHVEWIRACLDRLLTTAGALMANKRMLEKIKSGEAIDISNCPIVENRYRLLPGFTENVDYCIGDTESWIWSIGKHRLTGVILASTSADLYQNEMYDCLFLR